MKCQDARQHWDLYHDSEGDAELYLQCNKHLEVCAECADWFARQSRVETLIVERLAGKSPSDRHSDVDWPQVLAGAGVAPVTKPRSWFFLGSAMFALAASLLLLLGLLADRVGIFGAPSLSALSIAIHRQVSSGELRPEFESKSDIDVDEYLLRRVSFPVRCPPRKDSGFVVSGAGICELASQPAAYVVGRVDEKPVSVFVLPQESLEVFPQQHEQLRRTPLAASREADSEIVFSIIDKNVVLVIGRVERDKLTRVLKSYGTYPHVSKRSLAPEAPPYAFNLNAEQLLPQRFIRS